jgi:hypothetical protein
MHNLKQNLTLNFVSFVPSDRSDGPVSLEIVVKNKTARTCVRADSDTP